MLRGVSLQGTARQRSLLGTALASNTSSGDFQLGTDASGVSVCTIYTKSILSFPSKVLHQLNATFEPDSSLAM